MTYARGPVPTPRVTLRAIPPGDAGVAVTLAEMEDVARHGARSPLLRSLASRIVGSERPPDGPARLRSWLASRIHFRDDPPGVELLTAPEILTARALSGEPAGGDCDDVATLAAALGMAAGYPARFVVASFGPWPYEHVWTELHDGARWVELDTTRPAQFEPGAGVYRQTETAAMYATPGGLEAYASDQTTGGDLPPADDPFWQDAINWIGGLFRSEYPKPLPVPLPFSPDAVVSMLARQPDTVTLLCEQMGDEGHTSQFLGYQPNGPSDLLKLYKNDPRRFASLALWFANGTGDDLSRGEATIRKTLIAAMQLEAPSGDSTDWARLLYERARDDGPGAAEELLQEAARRVAGAIPEEWRRAVERGVTEYYTQRAGGAASALASKWGPLVLTAGAGFVIYTLAKGGLR